MKEASCKRPHILWSVEMKCLVHESIETENRLVDGGWWMQGEEFRVPVTDLEFPVEVIKMFRT